MWLLLAACQAPFGTDRHDLVGFRIAAVSAATVADGGTISPRAALIVDGHPWSAQPVDLSWYLLADADEVEALDPLSPADGTGPAPELVVPPDRRVLGLVARHGSDEERAFVELARPPATLSAPDGLTATPLEVDPGGTLRLRARFSEGEDPLVRWMATAGTFVEVDRQSADWVAADGLTLDGGELTGDPVDLADGPVTVLALALGEPGEATFRAGEVLVGDPPPGRWVDGRFVPGEGLPEVPAGGLLRATLREDASSPVGFRLEDSTVIDGPLSDFGTAALPCLVARQGPLDPAWWLEQLCFTAGLDGLQVVLAPDDAPPESR